MILDIMNRFLNTNEHIIYLTENEITFDELFNENFIEIPKNIQSIKMNEIYNNNLEFLIRQTNLTSLVLSHKFNNTIDNISHCTNLTKLHFGYFFDKDISPLVNLKKLEKLQLSERFIGSLTIIGNLTHLKKLNLGRDVFQDNYDHNIDFLVNLTNTINYHLLQFLSDTHSLLHLLRIELEHQNLCFQSDTHRLIEVP